LGGCILGRIACQRNPTCLPLRFPVFPYATFIVSRPRRKQSCKVIDKCICNVTNKWIEEYMVNLTLPTKTSTHFRSLSLYTSSSYCSHHVSPTFLVSSLLCIPCLSPRPHDPGPSSCIRLHQSINPLEAFHMFHPRNRRPYSWITKGSWFTGCFHKPL